MWPTTCHLELAFLLILPVTTSCDLCHLSAACHLPPATSVGMRLHAMACLACDSSVSRESLSRLISSPSRIYSVQGSSAVGRVKSTGKSALAVRGRLPPSLTALNRR